MRNVEKLTQVTFKKSYVWKMVTDEMRNVDIVNEGIVHLQEIKIIASVEKKKRRVVLGENEG